MIRPSTQLIIINGIEVPIPDEGYTIEQYVNVDSSRNTQGTIVAQVVGRPIWKINNLQWSRLTPEQWRTLKQALEPFFVTVTFTADDNERHTVTMYPGDKSSTPFRTNNLSYQAFLNCKFNLIDCGRLDGAGGEA